MECRLLSSFVCEISQQEYWTGLPFPSPGNLPNPGIEPKPPAMQEDSLLTEPPGKTGKLVKGYQINWLLTVSAALFSAR